MGKLIDLGRFAKFLRREALPAILEVEAAANDPAALIENLPWTDWAFDLADETGIPPRDVMAFVMAIKAKAIAEVRRKL
jgi:hypothetical protein